MTAGLYKPGQGYMTRMVSAIALGVLVFLGVSWLWEQLAPIRFESVETVYIQGAASVLTIVLFGILGWILIGRNPRSVDFLIATEGEMRKVHWSSRREVFGSTWVVIVLTLFIAVYCYLFDLVFQFFFNQIGVLELAGT